MRARAPPALLELQPVFLASITCVQAAKGYTEFCVADCAALKEPMGAAVIPHLLETLAALASHRAVSLCTSVVYCTFLSTVLTV